MGIDLDKPDSGELVKKLIGIEKFSILSILKFKLLQTSGVEIFTYILSVAFIIPYIYMLAKGRQPLEAYDTITKIIIGAYIGRILKKD